MNNASTTMGTEPSVLIDQLASAVASRISRAPLEVELWSAKEIAAWAKVSESHVLQRWACREDFPKARRPPVESSGRGRPRWRAAEVIEWMEQFQDSR